MHTITYLRNYLLTYILTYLVTYLFTYLLIYILVCLPASIPNTTVANTAQEEYMEHISSQRKDNHLSDAMNASKDRLHLSRCLTEKTAERNNFMSYKIITQ